MHMNDINESRKSNILPLIDEIKQLNFVESIVDVRGMSDGYTVFIRGTDGNAYELDIRPAALAKNHEDIRKAEQYELRKKAQLDKIRKQINW